MIRSRKKANTSGEMNIRRIRQKNEKLWVKAGAVHESRLRLFLKDGSVPVFWTIESIRLLKDGVYQASERWSVPVFWTMVIVFVSVSQYISTINSNDAGYFRRVCVKKWRRAGCTSVFWPAYLKSILHECTGYFVSGVLDYKRRRSGIIAVLEEKKLITTVHIQALLPSEAK